MIVGVISVVALTFAYVLEMEEARFEGFGSEEMMMGEREGRSESVS